MKFLTTIAVLSLGAAAGLYVHYKAHNGKIDMGKYVPALVRQIQEDRADARKFMKDGFLDRTEQRALYSICRRPVDRRTLVNRFHEITPEGERIRWGLYNMRNTFGGGNAVVPMTMPDGTKQLEIRPGKNITGTALHADLDRLLSEYEAYVQTPAYASLMGPTTMWQGLAKMARGLD
jgi:hypothetical protein